MYDVRLPNPDLGFVKELNAYIMDPKEEGHGNWVSMVMHAGVHVTAYLSR